MVLKQTLSLTSVDVSRIPCLDYSPLLALPLLSFVEMNDSSAQDVALVSGNPAIRELVAVHSGITDLDELKSRPDLVRLSLCYNEIKDLAGIERYQALKYLAIRNLPVDDLTPLIGLPVLEKLDLRGINADLSPLLRIPSLHKIICSPDMQPQIDRVKDEAEFTIETLEMEENKLAS